MSTHTNKLITMGLVAWGQLEHSVTVYIYTYIYIYSALIGTPV